VKPLTINRFPLAEKVADHFFGFIIAGIPKRPECSYDFERDAPVGARHCPNKLTGSNS
jgi:hypothetical protein